jgi:hypothetical protein
VSNVMDDFRHLETMSPTDLLSRRSTLIGSAPNGDYKKLPDETLQELIAIARVLRRKSSPATSTKSRQKDMVPTLDAI